MNLRNVGNLFGLQKKVGLQIGERKIKVIVLKRGRSQWEVEKKVQEDIPDDLVAEGKVLQPEMLGLRIRDVFSKHHIHLNQVSVVMEELPFFTRQMRLPKLSEKELEETIQYRASVELPVDVNDVIIRYRYYRSEMEDDHEVDIYNVFAVDRASVEKLVHAVNIAKLTVEAFGLEPKTIYEGLKFQHGLEGYDDPKLIVRTDTQRLLLAIYNHDQLVYARYLPFSLNEDDWLLEIERTIISWNSKHLEKPIENVLLLGKKDHWTSVKESIESFMPVTVRVLATSFTACSGSALNREPANNFYTDEEMSLSQRMPPIVKVFLPLVSLLLVVFLYFFVVEWMLQKEIDEYESKLADAKPVISLMEEEKTLFETKKHLQAVFDDVQTSHIPVLSLIQRIEQNNADSVAIYRTDVKETEILLSGRADHQEAVFAFIQALNADELFPTVQLIQSSEGEAFTQFSIKIKNYAKGRDSQ